MNVPVQYFDVDQLLDHAQVNTRLWVFLVNYLIKVNVAGGERHMRPYYRVYLVREQHTKLAHLEYEEVLGFRDMAMQTAAFSPQLYDSIVLLVRKMRKYVAVVYLVQHA